MYTLDHLTQTYWDGVYQLVKENREEAQNALPSLPQADPAPALHPIVTNGMGIVALDGKDVVGFLGADPPAPQWGAKSGVFVPLHAHAAKAEARGRIYSLLYQAAAEKWLDIGVVSHAICLYASDYEALESFYWNGFGMRCVDALRPMEPILPEEIPADCFVALKAPWPDQLLPLEHLCTQHLRTSPLFMPRALATPQEFHAHTQQAHTRYFAILEEKTILGYLAVEDEGENYLGSMPSMAHIRGAYLLPEFRGNGLFTRLLDFTIRILQKEGRTLLGVDYESMNPQARNFWGKHFTPYTYSVVRRVDEGILNLR